MALAILDELFIHVGVAHQYYNYFLKGGYLNGKKRYFVCKHWQPGIQSIDFSVDHFEWEHILMVCQECFTLDWSEVMKKI